MLKKVIDKEFWENVRQDDHYRFMIDYLQERYQKYCNGDITCFKYSDYKKFYNNGTRFEYETPYFDRRIRLETLFLLCLIYPENQGYIEDLQDTIWAICDEYCWALPAHQSDTEHNNNTMLDLFASETGFYLAEIKFLVGSRLEKLIVSRMEAEIKRRIIDSYLSREFFWENMYNNWNAVCAGSIACTFMYEKPELFYEIKPRIDKSIAIFLESYKDDGVCREGMSYWNYGFSFFAWYAEMLYDFSNGKYNYFNDKKVKEISQFFQKVFLQGRVAVSFADGLQTNACQLGLVHLLKSKYPDIIKIPDINNCFSADSRGRLILHLRSFEYYNPEYKPEPQTNVSYFLEESGWFIKKNDNYGFAVKGGDNDEPHNHNDIGSFIIAANNKQILCDLGMGEYTRQYFADETRYTILCNSSLGHSVPIINGCPQHQGKEYKGSVFCDDGVNIELSKAYQQDCLKSLLRRFTFEDKIIMMTDTYTFEDKFVDFTERLVTVIKPEIFKDYINIDNMKIEFNESEFSVISTQSNHRSHEAQDIPVYLIDFKPKGEQCIFKLKLIIKTL